VVNEAAACGLPLLVSYNAGCVETLVPGGNPTTGARFDPGDTEDIAARLRWVAALPEPERRALGDRATALVSNWGPDRFADGMIDALEIAGRARRRVPALKAG
jgi:1,2-diacylglycerol 3-alpha-glucosyltransferase